MSFYNDIDLNFGLDAKGDLAVVTEVSAINQGLRILVETITGSRPGPDNELFGLNLRQYLFSELSYVVAEQIGGEINRQLERYEPRINIENIQVDIQEEERAYFIDIMYTIRNTGKSGNFRMIVSLK
jgi:phage baseplate assembly protein W